MVDGHFDNVKKWSILFPIVYNGSNKATEYTQIGYLRGSTYFKGSKTSPSRGQKPMKQVHHINYRKLIDVFPTMDVQWGMQYAVGFGTKSTLCELTFLHQHLLHTTSSLHGV